MGREKRSLSGFARIAHSITLSSHRIRILALWLHVTAADDALRVAFVALVAFIAHVLVFLHQLHVVKTAVKD